MKNAVDLALAFDLVIEEMVEKKINDLMQMLIREPSTALLGLKLDLLIEYLTKLETLFSKMKPIIEAAEPFKDALMEGYKNMKDAYGFLSRQRQWAGERIKDVRAEASKIATQENRSEKEVLGYNRELFDWSTHQLVERFGGPTPL